MVDAVENPKNPQSDCRNSKSNCNDGRVTWEGCSVLLDINDGDRVVFARLSPGATIKIGDKKLSLRPLVWCPFGSLFEVETGSKGAYLTKVPTASCSIPSTTQDASMLNPCQDLSTDVNMKDNRSLVDDNSAQGLTPEDIDAMRREGAKGNEIIEALIANSSTFDKKTLFSQEKYKLKKQKKYAPKVLLRRPFTRSICEAYFKKHPVRIGHIRVDTLSLLLSMANVNAYSNVLVVDKVGGLLTGAIAERLGGFGHVCCTYFGEKPYSIDIVKMFNFNGEICSRIVQAPISSLASSNHTENPGPDVVSQPSVTAAVGDEAPPSCEAMTSETSVDHSIEGDITENTSCTKSMEGSDSPHKSPVDDEHENRILLQSANHKSLVPGRQASPDIIKLWKEMGFSSLVVAAPELHVESVIEEVLPLLAYSAPFAIYHQYLQPLANCMQKLQSEKQAINLQISEPWLREYQVLPSRTHPHMQMSGFGGYILSGIKICSGHAN